MAERRVVRRKTAASAQEKPVREENTVSATSATRGDGQRKGQKERRLHPCYGVKPSPFIISEPFPYSGRLKYQFF